MKDHLLHSLPEVYEISAHERRGDVPSLWMQASPSFDYLLQRFLRRGGGSLNPDPKPLNLREFSSQTGM